MACRDFKLECPTCGFICRASRGAVRKAGPPICGKCGIACRFESIEAAAQALPDDVLAEYPEFRREAMREWTAAIRDAVGISGERMRCGGCHQFIPAANHACGCGFQNDIRGRRNEGRWVEGASSCREYRDEAIPF